MKKKHNFGGITYVEPNTFAEITFYPNDSKTTVSFMGNHYSLNKDEYEEIAAFVLVREKRVKENFGRKISEQMLEDIVTRWIYEKPRK